MERVLEKIVAKSREELAERKIRVPVSQLEKRLADAPRVRDFRSALKGKGIRVIAELKAASPSKGVIRLPLPVTELAAELEQAGAAALSILTERNYFLGGLENLSAARGQVEIPLLRKDFLYEEYQILEARIAGADAVLLIAAMLSAPEYDRLRRFAASLGLAVLSEAHTAAELEMLLENGADIIGINARNLSTFSTSLDAVIRLIGRIPEGVVRVAESAIHSRADLEVLRSAGAEAFLVGEALMRAEHPGKKLCELVAK